MRLENLAKMVYFSDTHPTQEGKFHSETAKTLWILPFTSYPSGPAGRFPSPA